jgi:hypothetical protein
LISAHVANVIINWSEMQFNICRAFLLFAFIGTDVGVAVSLSFEWRFSFLDLSTLRRHRSKESYLSHSTYWRIRYWVTFGSGALTEFTTQNVGTGCLVVMPGRVFDLRDCMSDCDLHSKE